MLKKTKGYWGFDIKDMDSRISPGDDFYLYANGSWLRKNKIPAEESRWGAFTILRYETEHQLRELLRTLMRKSSYAKETNNQLVTDMFRSASDLKRRNSLEAKPIEHLLAKVRGISTIQELLDVTAELHVLGIGALWGASIDQDFKNSSKYLLMLWQGGLSLPDRDYYLESGSEQKRVRDAYLAYIPKLLSLSGVGKKDILRYIEAIMKIETELAKHSIRKEDTRDPEKIWHTMRIPELARMTRVIDWKKYFKDTLVPDIKQVNVGQPEFMKGLDKMLKNISLEEWKLYLEWHVINGTAGLLSEKLVKTSFDFYARKLTGVTKMKPLWRRALGAVSGTVGEALGQLYIKEYFPPSSKRAMDTLVSDLFVVYADRIKKLDWMSAATKKKALLKLKAMKRKIAYPTRWKGYKGLVVKNDDFFGNMLRSAEFEHRREMKKLQKPVDRSEWFMYPQTVNAYFSPSMNEIVFPAAILQWPFFDPAADAAINYAGIGSVIGHEMTHGFDDQGAKFDAKGNLKSWWGKDDKKRFEKKSNILVEQYNHYEVGGGVKVNGQLTLGENIADLGGLAIAWDAYQKHLHKVGRKNIQGLTPEERFFLGFAQMERELRRPEAVRTQALTDPHSPAEYRINGPLANFEPFYETFKLSPKSKLYRAPNQHAKIW